MMRVRALTFFYDAEIGNQRAERDEWETSVERARMLMVRNLVELVRLVPNTEPIPQRGLVHPTWFMRGKG